MLSKNILLCADHSKIVEQADVISKKCQSSKLMCLAIECKIFFSDILPFDTSKKMKAKKSKLSLQAIISESDEGSPTCPLQSNLGSLCTDICTKRQIDLKDVISSYPMLNRE